MDSSRLVRLLRVAALLGFIGVPTVAFAIWIGLTTNAFESAAPRPLNAQPSSAPARWSRLTANAGFPPSYNFPVVVAPDGRFIALHSEGTWISRNGREWTHGQLPWSGMNSGYLKYIQHNGATWALGALNGNYLAFSVDPVIKRTTNYESWEAVGRSSTLPQVVFYSATSFHGAMWLIGGYNRQQHETAEVWRSVDGLKWELMPKAPWSPRASPGVVVFRDRLYVIGGQKIDGPQANDVWSTADGIQWRRETERMTTDGMGGTLVVFANRLWQVGANRNSGGFDSAVLVSDDAKTWHSESAPWSPRGGVAVWVRNDSLFMTGGKYSTWQNGKQVFIYSNDVWVMKGTN